MPTPITGVTNKILGINNDTGAAAATNSLEASGEGFLVGGPAGAVAAGIASLAASFAQHTQRLRDATNENAALDQLIPAFDADIQQVVDAFNQGASATDCINGLYAIDSYAYTYLRNQVGKPGTAWGGPSDASLGTDINPSYKVTCDTKCTAGCCVYLNALRPAIFGRSGVGTSYAPFQTSSGIVGGLIEAIQKGGGTIHVVTVFPPPNKAYGNFGRVGYDLTVKAPSPVSSFADSILGGSALQSNGSSVVAVPASPLSALTGNSTIAILTVLTALILIVTALFGQNALRVK